MDWLKTIGNLSCLSSLLANMTTQNGRFIAFADLSDPHKNYYRRVKMNNINKSRLVAWLSFAGGHHALPHALLSNRRTERGLVNCLGHASLAHANKQQPLKEEAVL